MPAAFSQKLICVSGARGRVKSPGFLLAPKSSGKLKTSSSAIALIFGLRAKPLVIKLVSPGVRTSPFSGKPRKGVSTFSLTTGKGGSSSGRVQTVGQFYP